MASPVADAQAEDTRPSAATRRRIAYALTQRGRWAAAAVSLLALLAYALMLQLLANQHVSTVPWVGDTAGRLRMAPGDDAAWPGAAGHVIVGFADAALPALRELRSPRWQPQRALRERYFTDHALWAQAFAGDHVSLRLDDGRLLDVPLAARGLTGIGPLFWLAGLVGLALVVVAAASFSTAPAVTSGLFLWAAFFIALALWCAGMDASRGPTWPPGVAEAITTTWQCADVLVMAALLGMVMRYPVMTTLARAWWAPLLVALGVCAAVAHDPIGVGWWLAWGFVLLAAVAIVGLLLAVQRASPNPASHVLSRWGLGVLVCATLLVVALARVPGFATRHEQYLQDAELLLRALFALLLAAVPFLSRTQYLFRQLAVLLLVSGLVVVLDVGLISWFSLSQQTSLVVALLVAFWMYVPFRHWVVSRWLVHGRLTSPQLFERLYAVTRAAEQSASRASALWAAVLRDLFQPMDVTATLDAVDEAELREDGELLVVALPLEHGSIALRYAEEGKRLFSPADVSLVRNALAQVRGALAVEQAVEKGRTEERERIARDLHDDIGARLLTLMYRAPSKDVEDYARRTIQDLKTLVRGLALPGSTLEDSAAEWKAELAQRLATADIALEWHQRLQGNPPLGAEQWSALTRIIRELGSNTLQHARAGTVFVTLAYMPHDLDIVFTDDGIGTAPETWPHGLGLGGIRKRVGKLGGTVQWTQTLPRGVSCHINLPLGRPARPPAGML